MQRRRLLRYLKNNYMHYTLFEQLETVLRKDERLVAEGELLRNRIVELARKNDVLLTSITPSPSIS